MTLQEAIEARHSVRRYIHKPLSKEVIDTLQAKIEECNKLGNLKIQLVTNELRAFSGAFAYGQFSGVENYLVMVGRKAEDLDYRVGYYGEQLVLLAQQLELNTCWAGLSYRKVKDAYQVEEGEKIACMISLGYGNEPGRNLKRKTVQEVSNATSTTPEWFIRGVKAALQAPTAINQQKFHFEYVAPNQVKATKGFSLVGYTQMDLGIAMLHFEIGAGTENFNWI